MYDSNNQIIQTVTNDADGKFVFNAISVEKAGEYIFTVQELNDAKENIIYDQSVYTVKVIVTDNLDGTFSVDYAYELDDLSVEEITFSNTFTAGGEVSDGGVGESEAEPPINSDDEVQQSSDHNKEDTQTKSPQTGDNNNYFVWYALLLVSGTFIINLNVY